MAANPFSNENGAVLPWIQLSSTLQHQKRSHSKTLFRGPVHTNPFSNENGALLLWILPSSTLQCQKWSPKTEPFENALQRGAIWKRCFLKTLFSSVDGENDAFWKRWRHQNHSTVSIQNGGQALPWSFNFPPISRADTLKCTYVEFIWPCALRV